MNPGFLTSINSRNGIGVPGPGIPGVRTSWGNPLGSRSPILGPCRPSLPDPTWLRGPPLLRIPSVAPGTNDLGDDVVGMFVAMTKKNPPDPKNHGMKSSWWF